MRNKKHIYKKNIRVTKKFKDALIEYCNGREQSETITNIILWYNIDFNLHNFTDVLFTSIKYSSVQQEPLDKIGDKNDQITVKLDWSDFEVFEANCIKLGIETSEGIRRVIRQVVDNHQAI